MTQLELIKGIYEDYRLLRTVSEIHRTALQEIIERHAAHVPNENCFCAGCIALVAVLKSGALLTEHVEKMEGSDGPVASDPAGD